MNQLTTADYSLNDYAGKYNTTAILTDAIIDPNIFSNVIVNHYANIKWGKESSQTRTAFSTYSLCSAVTDEELVKGKLSYRCSASQESQTVTLDLSEITEKCYVKVYHYYESGTKDCGASVTVSNIYGTIK